VAALWFSGPASAQQLQRVNLAKLQSVTSDSAAAGCPALFVTDGTVGNSNCWQSSGAGPHWAAIALPLSMQLGSAQLYLGADDTKPVTNFSLQYLSGATWVTIPGADFTGNTSTVLNVVFSSPVTASQVRFYSSDASVTVREIALFGTNGPSGYPIGTDVSLNVGKKCNVVASSVAGSNFAEYAVDGYAGNSYGWWQTANVNGPHTLEVDFQAATRIGSAHLYSGTATAPAVADFTLEYWTGSAWAAIPGGTVSGNTQQELIVPFTSPVSTTKVLLMIPDNGTQIVRQLAVFAAATGFTGYPIGTDVVTNNPPLTQFETFSDSFYQIINQTNGLALVVNTNGATQAAASNVDTTQQFQVLYNIDSDTFRIRNRASWQCLAAQNAGTTSGTAVVTEPGYYGMPHELWRLVSLGGGYYQILNVWNGLVLQTDGQTPATVTLATPSADPRQQWQLGVQAIYPKKGLADYAWTWATFSASWNYDWGINPVSNNLPASVVFSPMQWNGVGIGSLPQYYPGWHTNSKPASLLGFNEPDQTGQANMTTTNCIALWPQMQATDMPLVSPATSWPLIQWMTDFYNQVTNNGFRVDYTGVHWYAYPYSPNLVSNLQNVYTNWWRPIWLTEFGSVDWDNNQWWTEETCYTFLAEFLWCAEDMSYLRRYSIFPFNADPPPYPWSIVHPAPTSSVFYNDGVTLTAFGQLYAAWDADRNIRAGVDYIVHNKGAVFRLGDCGAAALTNFDIRVSDATVQWTLMTGATTGHYYLASMYDGRCLSYNGTNLALAASSATGPAVEWIYSAYTNGYFFIEHPATGLWLGMNRTNDTNGAPTAVTLVMDPPGTTNDNTSWRFIKPLVTACATNQSAPMFAGLASVTPATEAATLSWSAASGVPPLVYEVREGTASGSESVLLDTNSLSVFVPLYPGSNSPITYFFIVKAIDGCGHYDTNQVELSVQPLLNPNKSQVGDGIPNGWKQRYGLNPFNPNLVNEDLDGTGFTVLQDYLVGIDPTNSATYFHITSVARTSNNISVTWMMGPGKTNGLQFTAGAGDGSYQTNSFADIFTVTNTVGSVTNYLDVGGATNQPARFYRVRLVQ
jgi:hypothetical protein